MTMRYCAYALIATHLVLASSEPTTSPTPGVGTKSPTEYDPLVGTANAPTTPGGACLGTSDYGIWTEEFDGETGFERWIHDLTECSTFCVSFLTQSQSSLYQCGGFAQAACDDDLFGKCIPDCMNNNEPVASDSDYQEKSIKQRGKYTDTCIACSSEIARCGILECGGSCLPGGETNEACLKCNEEKCNPAFITCSGLNPQKAHAQPIDTVPIIAGAVGGVMGLLALALLYAYYDRKVSKKQKALSPDELARMAKAQSMGVASNKVLDSPGASNPKYHQSGGSTLSGGASMSPYQMQYQQQQADLASGGAGRSVGPSVRMSQMAKDAMGAPQSVYNTTKPLVAAYDFVGEREDELTVNVGDRMFGIEQQDGWWLAKTEKGIVGLIPVSYTAADNSGGGGNAVAPAAGADEEDPNF